MFAVHCFKRAQNQSLDAAIRRKAIGDLGKALASWRNAAYLAAGLQRHAHLRPAFPALQVNETVEAFNALREGMAVTAGHVSCTDFGVPRTHEELDLVPRDLPSIREYRLFAGLLRMGLRDLDFKWRDYELGITDHAPVELSSDDFPTYVGTFFSRLAALMDPLMRPFEADAQERAFGPPGESGDPGRVEHFARRILIAYEAMLDWASELRAIDAAPPFDRLGQLAPGYVAGPIRQVRNFVETLCSQLEAALEALEGKEPDSPPIVIDLDLTIALDPVVLAEWRTELKKAERRLR
jgi:hypothetical protein